MVVSLPAELEAFVEQELAGHRYRSREDLVVDAIRLLRDRSERDSPNVDWFEHALDQFRAIVGLPPGWDSNDATAPDPTLVQVAATLLYRLARSRRLRKPHINPTRRGGVQFEWEADSRSLEVEVLHEDRAAYFFQDDTAGIEEQGEFSPAGSLDVVAQYVRRVEGGRQD